MQNPSPNPPSSWSGLSLLQTTYPEAFVHPEAERRSAGWLVRRQSLKSRLEPLWNSVKLELLTVRLHVRILHIVLFLGFIYVAMYPLRRISHYHHKTLADYWPDAYSAPASMAHVEVIDSDGDTEQLSLEDFLNRVAPGHGLTVRQVSISRENYAQSCKGCISKPLRLKDIGHFLTPDWSASGKSISSEWCQLGSIAFSILVGLSAIFIKNPEINGASMLIRVIRVATVLHSLRPLFHTVTQLPGPAMHCQSSVVNGGGHLFDPINGFSSPYLIPADDTLKSFLHTLFRFSNEKTCGDLMFSGHMINATLPLVQLNYFASKLYGPRGQLFVLITTIVFFLAQLYLILCSRNHYSVDLVGSIVISILVGVLDLKLLPNEFRYADGADFLVLRNMADDEMGISEKARIPVTMEPSETSESTPIKGQRPSSLTFGPLRGKPRDNWSWPE